MGLIGASSLICSFGFLCFMYKWLCLLTISSNKLESLSLSFSLPVRGSHMLIWICAAFWYVSKILHNCISFMFDGAKV